MASSEEDARRQLDQLNKTKGDVIRRLEDLDSQWGVQDLDSFERKLEQMQQAYDLYEQLDVQNGQLSNEMETIADQFDINLDDYGSY